jgi:hypothetical protein
MPIRSFDPKDYVELYKTLHCCKCDSDFTFYSHHNPHLWKDGRHLGYICQNCYSKLPLLVRTFDKVHEWMVQASIAGIFFFVVYCVYYWFLNVLNGSKP